MAANLFDHPYAAAANNLSDSDADSHSESEKYFKDSPRKVLVQTNKGKTLNILNDIIQNQDFSCLNKSIDSLKENGFQIDKSVSSSDEMEVDKDVSSEKEDSLEPNKCVTGKEEQDSGTPNRKDVLCGITSVFDAKYIEQKSNVNGKDDDNSSDRVSDEKQDSKNETEISKKEETEKTDKMEVEDLEKDLADEHGASDADKEGQEMDTSVNDDGEDEDTEDADEGEFYTSLENATNLTSEIKKGEGNGIVVSVMKKKKRKRKRKNSLWTRSSPYKIRRLSDESARTVSTEKSSQSISKEGKDHIDRDIDKDTESAEGNDESAENAGTQTLVEDSQQDEEKKGETSQSGGAEGIEERLRSRRSRTPANKEGFEMGDAAFNEVEQVDLGLKKFVAKPGPSATVTSEEILGTKRKSETQGPSGSGSTKKKKDVEWLGVDIDNLSDLDSDEDTANSEDSAEKHSASDTDKENEVMQEESTSGDGESSSDSSNEKDNGQTCSDSLTNTEVKNFGKSDTDSCALGNSCRNIDSKTEDKLKTEKVLHTESTVAEKDVTQTESEQVEKPFCLDDVTSVQELESLGLDRLKQELMSRGLKCGGTLQQRAERLFSVKGLTRDQIDPTLFAKSADGKKVKNRN